MKRIAKSIVLSVIIAGLMGCAGCQPDWSISLAGLQDEEQVVDYPSWETYAAFVEDETVPLEQILYGSGARVIDRVTISSQDGREYHYPWAEAAGQFVLEKKGVLKGQDLEIRPVAITAVGSDWESKVEGHIYDIAATASEALGIEAPALSTGVSLGAEPADAVLLLFLDGFGYLRYQEALEEGSIPELAKLDPPLVGLTTYPPITTVSSASLLTGTEPFNHGVELRGIRKTDQETLLDVAERSGLTVVAVEGEALAFNLRGAELELSGDRDGNGGTDDNVLANALEVLESGMPDLFWVHFHGIDDQGHEVGPGQPAEQEKIREVDTAVGQILERLPSGTLVIIFADHGMHMVNEDGRLGNHEHLIPRDMLIPIWIIKIEN